MNPKAEQLQARTHAFLMRVIRFCDALPRRDAAVRIAGQLIDAAGGTDSNYRAACRARSPREFIAKVGVAAEEADECVGWLQALRAGSFGDSVEAAALQEEAIELTKIFTASQKTARRNAAKLTADRRTPQSRQAR